MYSIYGKYVSRCVSKDPENILFIRDEGGKWGGKEGEGGGKLGGKEGEKGGREGIRKYKMKICGIQMKT